MVISKISAKGQTTIPTKIRKRFGSNEGATLLYEIKNDDLVIRKIEEQSDPYLKAITSTLTEWDSVEDNEVWNDL